MSREFNKYLSEKLTDYFRTIKVKAGKKYYAKFDTPDTLNSFYLALKEYAKDNEVFESYVYEFDEKYRTFAIRIEDTYLLVAREDNEVTLDFLTRFRNSVGNIIDGVDYSRYALLLLITSNLDSIIDGTESLHREGLPFYYVSIINDIDDRIKADTYNLSQADKEIIKIELGNRKTDKYGDKTSLELYKPILEMIDSGKIRKSQYRAFSMFFDSELGSMKQEEMPKRINENRKWYQDIEDSIRTKNVEAFLTNKIGNALLTKFERLEKDSLEDDWSEEFDFKQIKKSIDEKKSKENLSIERLSMQFMQQCFCEEDNSYYRYKNYKSNVKNKKESWLIFNDDNYTNINIVVEFSDRIKSTDVHYDSGLKPEFSIDGYKLKLRIDLPDGGGFSRFTINDVETNCKIEINICLLSIKNSAFNTIIPKIKLIDSKKKYILLEKVEDDIKFNIESLETTAQDLVNRFRYTLQNDVCLELMLSNATKELDKLSFFVVVAGIDVEFIVEQSQEKSTVISGIKLFSEKLAGRRYTYDLQNKISYNKIEYRLDKQLKDALDYESSIIKEGIVFGRIKNNIIKKIYIALPIEIQKSYDRILAYYINEKTLPSLCPLNDRLIGIYRELISAINTSVNGLEEDKPITNNDNKNIIMIGACEIEDESTILLSPLHPINIAHQIALYDLNKKADIDIDIVKKLNSRFAYPYFYGDVDKLYKVVDNNETLIEWKSYVLTKDSRKNGARYFVSRLVNDKIDLFVKHFGCMFSEINNNILKINLINMGDCAEVFDGLIKYYIDRLNTDCEEDVKQIIVTIYNDSLLKNTFDILSNETAFKEYVLNRMDANKCNLNELVAFIKDKLSYYVKLSTEDVFEYAHLSFYEMPSQVTAGSNNMENIDSGISLNAILSGLTSKYMGDSYRTSFGAKDIRKNLSSDLYKNMNALALYSRRSDPFNHNGCISTEVKDEKESLLKKIYDSAHWVTFIDPKVDLNFFIKSKFGEKLTIIHYSDQYTTTSGYDAITVTNKTQQYINLIREHMSTNHMSLTDEDADKIINAFNAINGNWLLNLISSDKRYEKEKISLISAVKIAMAKFKSQDIIWVPMAMEEILRVTGAVKLNAKQGLLSAKNLGTEKGSKSDDLLMVGIDVTNKDNILVYLHPIEVKIGEQGYICSSKDKAKAQIEATKKKILDKSLGEDVDSDIVKQLRRNYLMQLVLIAAQKLKLYKIWDKQNWDIILEGTVREKLLNEDYTISNCMDSQIGIGSIMQFANIKDETNIRQCKEDDCIIMQSTVQYALEVLTQDIEKIIADNNFDDITTLAEMVEDNKALSVVENAITNLGSTEEAVDSIDEIPTAVDESVAEVSIVAEERKSEIEIIFGVKKNGTNLLWLPNNTNKIMHTNTGIIGTMGTGKTQFTKSVITQIYRESKYNIDGKSIGILIFDYKGDYNQQKKDFIEATNAKVFSLFHLPFNPLSITTGGLQKPMLPLHIANTFKETLAKAYGLGIKQETLLRDIIIEAYAAKGIDKADKSTWNKVSPTFRDIYNLYINKEGIKEDSLYAAMKAIDEFEIFESDASKTKSLYDLIDGVTVIDLSGYDMQIQNLVVAITLDLFYSQMQASGHSKIEDNLRQLKKIILVDEADNFLSQGFGSIKKIMKEGREFGVGTILSTQLLSHFSNENDDFANYIFTWVIHNVSDLSPKDVRKIFNTQSKVEEDKLYRDIKNLQKHHSIVKFSSISMPEYIEDLPFYKLI